MAIPTYDKLFRPVLELAARQPITRTIANEEVTRQFQLTPAEVELRLASGVPTVLNRTGWAMTFLTKASLIEKIAPKTYRATASGIEFLKTHPTVVTVADLKKIPGFEEAWDTGRQKRLANAAEHPGEDERAASSETPEEIIDREVKAVNAVVRERILNAILAQSPKFFELLVLDVLHAMGYGGELVDATEHLGQTGDEGIDGRINQDALGLDQILVQAKRYAPGNTVGRPAIQGFVGSLAGLGVTKGIFITTSSFAGKAQDYVQRGSNLKVVLVDGEMLVDLMLKHGIGAREAHRYEVYELDQNYFEEAE